MSDADACTSVRTCPNPFQSHQGAHQQRSSRRTVEGRTHLNVQSQIPVSEKWMRSNGRDECVDSSLPLPSSHSDGDAFVGKSCLSGGMSRKERRTVAWLGEERGAAVGSGESRKGVVGKGEMKYGRRWKCEGV